MTMGLSIASYEEGTPVGEIASLKRRPSSDDIAVWADGEWARMDEIWKSHFSWKSDDFEIVAFDNLSRLQELGIHDQIC